MDARLSIIGKRVSTWLDLKSAYISVETIAIFSIAFLFLFASTYSAFAFVQFEKSQILETSLFFIFLCTVLILIFNPWVIGIEYKVNGLNIFLSIFIFSALILWLYSPDRWVFDYFRAFPTIEAEVGLGWHIDSTFHVSILKSIITFGYPSSGQHDVPMLYYHVLSHYIEALFIYFSGIDAWDSYGMFFYFKRVTILAAILFFVAAVCRRKVWYFFILSVFFLMPVVTASWHLVGSHGLWFPSLLLILSSPKVYSLLNRESGLDLKNYVFLFVLIVLLSFGKVSVGFTYSILIGLVLLLKNWKDYRIYIFGMLLLVFFALFSSKFILGGESFKSLNILVLFRFFLLQTNEINNQLYQVYVLLLIAGILATVFRFKILKNLMYSGLLSVLILGLYFNISINTLTPSDIYYFIYGLYSVLILLIYQGLVDALDNGKIYGTLLISPGERSYNVNFKFALFIGIIFLVGKLNLSYINLYSVNIGLIRSVFTSINSQPFEQINRKSDGLKLSVLGQISGSGLKDFANYPTTYRRFRSKLTEFMHDNGLTSNNTLLFMPKEIYAQEPNLLGKIHWARGLFLYAFTGVPLINGVSELYGGYGYRTYKTTSTWMMRSDFNQAEACLFKKNIIVVESFDEGKFSLIKCK